MDALFKKIQHVNDIVYFVRSSVENPYIYIRFTGFVREVEVREDRVFYRIQVLRVIESYEFCQQFLNRARFRVKNAIDAKYIDKFFYVYDIEQNSFTREFAKRYSCYWFDMPSMLVYSNEADMENDMSKINKHLMDKLGNTLNTIAKRVIS